MDDDWGGFSARPSPETLETFHRAPAWPPPGPEDVEPKVGISALWTSGDPKKLLESACHGWYKHAKTGKKTWKTMQKHV